ncbi:hypothetical protein [Clostridium lundense]|uniref:hypothetical protein n=1 Tax=Clostridium lundense TaxID=319475 RepID=UPI000488625B|nr:hypothetical protein [Clostridium lundense]
MSNTNFIPYSFMEENLERKKKIFKLIFFIALALLLFSICILKANMNRLNNLKREEKTFDAKVQDMCLKENNKIIKKNIEDLWEITKDNNNFYFITLRNNTLYIDGIGSSIKECKQSIINLEQKNNFTVVNLKGPEKKGDNYYYKVGVALNAR